MRRIHELIGDYLEREKLDLLQQRLQRASQRLHEQRRVARL